MKAPRRRRTDSSKDPTLFGNAPPKAPPSPEAPDFVDLLRKPLVKLPLPSDFDAAAESVHLAALWQRLPPLRCYQFESFVHAGGSGMVFKVLDSRSGTPRALKLARRKLCEPRPAGQSKEAARTLSPVSESELRALERLSHPSVVRLFEALSDGDSVLGVATAYVDNPKGIDVYLREVLEKDPKGRKGIHAFSPQRLDEACSFLLQRIHEIASALAHMHDMRIYHFDVKPANILISGQSDGHRAILTDMGACVHADQLAKDEKIRVHFTWTYAHNSLTSIINDPKGITGGGLKASALVVYDKGFARYDLFALGKTLLECLAILEAEFGERSHASYGFRFLHIIAGLLLDGTNAPAPAEGRIVEKDGRRFAADVALEYPPHIFALHRITGANELLNRLNRFTQRYAWEGARELEPWQPDIVNSGVHSPAPFTMRMKAVFDHGTVKRLIDERQLGWMNEVYPGATHNRWTHCVGVSAALAKCLSAMLADPEVPTFRILVDETDILHAILAAALHDLAQTTFGHDFEEACPWLFRHDEFRRRLLDENKWGDSTLRHTIRKLWPAVDIERVLRILEHPSVGQRQTTQDPAVDGVFADLINGPIDTDKLDYLLRDSNACGVPYGSGVDVERFMRALTVTAHSGALRNTRLDLAYKAKGRPAVTSVLLARYQMFGAVYWHHTFRCIQAMFAHAAAAAFATAQHGPGHFRGTEFTQDTLRDLLYHRVLCARSWDETCKAAGRNDLKRFFAISPLNVAKERALDFLWQFSDASVRPLIERLAHRDLFKRVFEFRLGELGNRADYSAMKGNLIPPERVAKAHSLQSHLLNEILNAMRERGPRDSASESTATQRLGHLQGTNSPLVVIDFPVRGVAADRNMPNEIGDAVRKYFTLPKRTDVEDNVFSVITRLQEQMATIRVFAAPELHELVIRYLSAEQIHACVSEVIPELRR